MICSYQWAGTPLGCASERGYLQVVRLLTARGAELESRDMVRLSVERERERERESVYCEALGACHIPVA